MSPDTTSPPQTTPAPQRPPELRLLGLPLSRYAGVQAGLAEGLSLEQVLANEGVDARTYAEAAPAWAERLAEAEEGDPEELEAAYEEHLARARARYGRRALPLADDLRAWLAFLHRWSTDPDPPALLERLGLRLPDLARLQRDWGRRLAEQPELLREARGASEPSPEPPPEIVVEGPQFAPPEPLDEAAIQDLAPLDRDDDDPDEAEEADDDDDERAEAAAPPLFVPLAAPGGEPQADRAATPAAAPAVPALSAATPAAALTAAAASAAALATPGEPDASDQPAEPHPQTAPYAPAAPQAPVAPYAPAAPYPLAAAEAPADDDDETLQTRPWTVARLQALVMATETQVAPLIAEAQPLPFREDTTAAVIQRLAAAGPPDLTPAHGWSSGEDPIGTTLPGPLVPPGPALPFRAPPGRPEPPAEPPESEPDPTVVTAPAPLTPPGPALPFQPAPPAAPLLSLPQYASLCAELAVFPEDAEQIFCLHGLAEEPSRRAVDERWKAQLRDEPALYAAWQDLYRQHLTLLLARRSAAR